MTIDEMIQYMCCPGCGQEHTLEAQDVEETLTIGEIDVRVTVRAGVCSYCQERVFGPEAAAVMDRVVRDVREGNLSNLVPVGQVYRAS